MEFIPVDISDEVRQELNDFFLQSLYEGLSEVLEFKDSGAFHEMFGGSALSSSAASKSSDHRRHTH